MTNDTVISKCEKICADCPFRRDSTRLTERGWPDAAAWYMRHCWPNFEPPTCTVEASVCLGWAVHMANQWSACMVPSTVRDWVEEWGVDVELIFESNNQFIRYHRGEEFGGDSWFEDRRSRFLRPTPSTKFNEQGQGEMF